MGDPGDCLHFEGVQAIRIGNGDGEGISESYCSTEEAVFVCIGVQSLNLYVFVVLFWRCLSCYGELDIDLVISYFVENRS